MKLHFVTRSSALALQQTRWVMAMLKKAHPDLVCVEKMITTRGDKILDKPLPEIGGKGLFTQELEHELLSGAADCAVHSIKDLPVENPPGLTVGCVPLRAEVRDVLVSKSKYHLENLPPGALVGTSSLRRMAQILSLRPDVTVASLRGNVDTRLQKAREGLYDAVILAGAGLVRLGLQEQVTQWLPLDVMLPAPGQGALAVQCRADDTAVMEILSVLEDPASRAAVTAERQFLLGLGGGCAVPVAAHAQNYNQSALILLTGLVASADGKECVKVSGAGTDPLELGSRLARKALSQGAGKILTRGGGS